MENSKRQQYYLYYRDVITLKKAGQEAQGRFGYNLN